MASAYNNRLGLPPPFPSHPSGPKSNFGLYMRKGDFGLNFISFHSAYAGKHALNVIIGDSNIRWLNDDEILIEDTGLRVRGEAPGQLDALIEKKLTSTEEQFELPEPYRTWCRILGGETRAAIHHAPPDMAPRKKQRLKSPTQNAGKSSAPRAAKPNGLVSIADIAQQLGKDPRECRVALRKLKMEKPPHGGWAWPATEADEVRAKLQKVLQG